MIDIKRYSNKEKFEIALSKVSLRFPVAEISQKTGYGKSQVSKILSGSIPISDEFLKKFIESFNIVLEEPTKGKVKKEDPTNPAIDSMANELLKNAVFREGIKQIQKEISTDELRAEIEKMIKKAEKEKAKQK